MSKLRSTTYLSLARFISVALGLVAYRFYIQWLGPSNWGLVAVATTLSQNILLVADPSLSTGLANKLVEATTQGDQDRFDRLVASHRFMMLLTGFVGLLAHFVVAFTTNLNIPGGLNGSLLLFGSGGLSLFFYLSFQGLSAIMQSRSLFPAMALSTLVGTMANLVVSVILTFGTKHPWGFMFGTMSGSLVMAIMGTIFLKKEGLLKLPIRYHRDAYRPIWTYGKTGIFLNSGTALGQSDRYAIKSTINDAAVGQYDLAARVPMTLLQMLPIPAIFQPEMARAYFEGPKNFAESFEKNMQSGLVLILGCLFLPSAFGAALLKFWLGPENVTPEMIWVIGLYSIDSTFAMYNWLGSNAFAASSKTHILIPFLLFAGGSVLLFSTPVAAAYGIIGAAGLRVAIQLAQFFFFDWAVYRFVCPEIHLARHMMRKTLIFMLALGVWGLGYEVSQVEWLKVNFIFQAPFLPALVYTFVFLCGRLKLVTLPAKLKRFFPGV